MMTLAMMWMQSPLIIKDPAAAVVVVVEVEVSAALAAANNRQ